MPVAPRSQRLTAPEDWRVNIGRRTITHINGLVARMEPDPFQKGRLAARPTSLDRLPPRWRSFHLVRAMKEAEAAYYAAVEKAAQVKAAAMAKALKLSTDVRAQNQLSTGKQDPLSLENRTPLGLQTTGKQDPIL